MSKVILCEFCRKEAKYWIGSSGISVCNNLECQSMGLKRVTRLKEITEEEKEVFGE